MADCRRHREEDDELETGLSGRPNALIVPQVLSGLGGVGKTQLAANFALKARNDPNVDLIVWVQAASRDGILKAYAAASREITRGQNQDLERDAERFLSMLRYREDRRWLVILDDLQSPSDLNGLWPPIVTHGRTVVTTRRRDHALLAGRHLIQVGLFTPEQATNYLVEKLVAAKVPHLALEAGELAADLGYLPLALAQAAAYILDQGLTCTVYRRRFADRRKQLQELFPVPDSLPDQHQFTVAATWSISIDRAEEMAPRALARPILEVAAFLDFDAIPTTLITSASVLEYLGRRCGFKCEDDMVFDALHVLGRLNLVSLNMVSLDPMLGVVNVHSLLRRVVREKQTGRRRSELSKFRELELLGQEERSHIERIIDRQEADFSESLELTIDIGTNDDSDWIVERRQTTPRGSMSQRAIRPIVPMEGNRTTRLADIALTSYRLGGGGTVTPFSLAEKVAQLRVWLVFDPPPTKTFEWIAEYHPVGLWRPLRARGIDTLVWHDRMPASGTDLSVISRFKVDFVFPSSESVPSIVERHDIGTISPPRRIDNDRWLVTWQDERPTGRSYYWDLIQPVLGKY